MINTLKNHLREKMSIELPGMVAHAQMTEDIRVREMMKKDKTPRKAGVLILIYLYQNKLHVPMILRPIYEGVHSGQMAFPGGRYELEDKDLIATALRETHEEVGVKIYREAVIGKLTDLYIPPSNSLVTPVVGLATHRPNFIADPREVAAIHEFPLSAFIDKNNRKEVSISLKHNYKIKTPGFVINDNIIWGASAMIMNELLHLLADFKLD
jgi:8-oxo-dGTP pyrophosphatase MutT (NUDIX family)